MTAHTTLIAALLAAFFGQGDWELTIPATGEKMCAKSEAVCEDARRAVYKGWLLDIPRGTQSVCTPRPQCFPPESLCIEGFNCPGNRSGG